MRNSSDLQTEIRLAYEYLEDKGYVLGPLGKISVLLEDNTVLEYSVKDGFVSTKIEKAEAFASRKDVGFVINMHSPYTLALSVLDESLPCVTTQMAAVIGGNVSYTYSPDIKAILLKNRGAYCFGKTLEDAILCCKVLESAAMVYVTLAPFGSAKELTREEIEKQSTV